SHTSIPATVDEVLDDSARIADRLPLDHQYGHATLVGESLDFSSPGAALRDDDLLVEDPVPLQRACDFSAWAQPIRGSRAAVQGGHLLIALRYPVAASRQQRHVARGAAARRAAPDAPRPACDTRRS